MWRCRTLQREKWPFPHRCKWAGVLSTGIRRYAPHCAVSADRSAFVSLPARVGSQDIVSAMTSQRVLRRFAKDWVTRVVRCPLRDPMVACWNGVMMEATARPQQASDPPVRRCSGHSVVGACHVSSRPQVVSNAPETKVSIAFETAFSSCCSEQVP